jgi:hypothetical protein
LVALFAVDEDVLGCYHDGLEDAHKNNFVVQLNPLRVLLRLNLKELDNLKDDTF